MLILYLICASLGGGLIALSLFGHDHDHDHESHDDVAWISLRSLTYCLGFFGLTGVALHYLSDAPAPLSAAIASGVGVAAGAMATAVRKRLVAENASGGGTTKVAAGHQGQVLVGFSGNESGRIRLQGASSHTELMCEGDGETFEEGDEVLITDIKRGVARVSKLKG